MNCKNDEKQNDRIRKRLQRRMTLSITPSPSPVRAKSAGVIIILFDRKRAVSYQIKKAAPKKISLRRA